MYCHQGDLVVAVLVVGHVHVAEQRHVLEEAVEREEHFVASLLESLGVPLLDIGRNGVHELLDIRGAALAFYRAVRFEERVQSAVVGDAAGKLVCVGSPDEHRKGVYHLAEGLHLGQGEAGLEERSPVRGGEGLEVLDSRRAYAPRRPVHRPLEALVVHGVDAELEICHQVLDLGTVEERVAGVYHIGYVAPAQLLLKGAGLRIGAVEQCEVAVLGMFGAYPRHYLRGDAHGLVLFRTGVEQPYLLAVGTGGITILGYTALVVGYQRIGGVDYGLGRPVVALQAEGPALGVVLPEVEYVLYLGPAERVDRLAVVTHHADVPAEIRKPPEYYVLRLVGVLVLVHHYIGEAVGDVGEGLGVVAQQVVHVQEYVVEVHDPGGPELLLVPVVEFSEHGFPAPRIGLCEGGVGKVGLPCHQIVLHHRYAREHLLGLVGLVVEIELLQAGLYGAHGVGGVVYGEVPGIAEAAGIVAQEPDEDGMEGAHDQPAGPGLSYHKGYPLLHLGGGLLGEGQGQYLRGLRSLGKEIGYAARQDPRLAGTGSSHYEHRAFRAAHGAFLLVVQGFQYRVQIICHGGAKLRKNCVSSHRNLLIK